MQAHITPGFTGTAACDARGLGTQSADVVEAGGAVAGDEAAGGDGRRNAASAGCETLDRLPKRRRLRGKQPPLAVAIEAEADVYSREALSTARDGAIVAGRGTNSLQVSSAGPSRFDTSSSYRHVLSYNRDGHVLNSGDNSSGARCSGAAMHDTEGLVLGHAADTGRPPDAAP